MRISQKNLLAFFTFLSISNAAFANPYITKIPLPKLHGTYTNSVDRQTNFDSGLIFSEIIFVDIYLKGFYSPGILRDVSTNQLENIDWYIKSTSPLDAALWTTDDIQEWGGEFF